MYLAVIIDLFSRKVVGWSLGERMKASLVCEALDAAMHLRCPAPGLVFHSHRGSQYATPHSGDGCGATACARA
jgi:putative transposase